MFAVNVSRWFRHYHMSYHALLFSFLFLTLKSIIFSIVRVCMHHKQGMGTEGERHGAGAAEPPPAYDQSANAPQVWFYRLPR